MIEEAIVAKEITVLVGSLRRGSIARKIARAVIPMFPEGYNARIAEIGGLPLYNADYDNPEEDYAPSRRAILISAILSRPVMVYFCDC